MVYYSEKMMEDEEEKFRVLSCVMEKEEYEGEFAQFKREFDEEQECLAAESKYDEMMYY